MGKPRHISILPTRPISCAQADPAGEQPHRAGQPGFHSQDTLVTLRRQTQENQNRDAEEEVSSDSETIDLTVHL